MMATAPAIPGRRTPARAVRSLLFFVPYLAYLTLVMEPLQWLVIGPLVTLLPSRRRAVVRAWIRLTVRLLLAWSRAAGGLRVAVQGEIPPESCIVLMNHQSVFDVALGLWLFRGPYPLIPTRTRYRWLIPGASTLMRLMGNPFVTGRHATTRAQFRVLASAADRVARGEHSCLIFPEGHRSRNRNILPFMTSGLSLLLSRARNRPVYIVVTDGLEHLCTMSNVALGFAGTSVRMAIRGPYTIPDGDRERAAFVDFLRDRMVEVRAGLAAPTPGGEPLERARSGAR